MNRYHDLIVEGGNFLMSNFRRILRSLQNFYVRKLYGKRKKPIHFFNFVVDLVDHCNLNCWGCDHFSPLADPYYLDLAVFSRDIERLSDLFKGKAFNISLMGGEPLLHPELEKFLPVVRKAFPDAPIRIVTNGLLLEKKDDIFWQACRANCIEVVVTIYPGMEKRFENAKKKAILFGVDLYSYGRPREVKTSHHVPFDLEGKQSPETNFKNCFHANSCVQLREGRLYTCTVAANAHVFNKYFLQTKIPLQLADRDSINIYDAQNADEIMEFLSNPIPFCRYCAVDARSFGHIWQHSKKDIGEWTV